jgi:hypothetical protein
MIYYVEGLVQLDDTSSEVRQIGEFAKLDEAIGAAEGVIQRFLMKRFSPDMTAQALFALYRESGVIPFIFVDGDKTLNVSEFNHFKSALAICHAMCGTPLNAGPDAAPQAEPFPALISDEEFEAAQKRQLGEERKQTPFAHWDTTAFMAGSFQTDGHPESTIEQRHEHIAKSLIALWPSEACAVYLQRLLESDRAAKEKLPRDVTDDLLMLHAIISTHVNSRKK